MTHRKPGRPAEGRKKVSWYVVPATILRVQSLMDDEKNTPGKVIDHHMKKASK